MKRKNEKSRLDALETAFLLEISAKFETSLVFLEI